MSGYRLTRRVLLAATGPAALWALHASREFAQPDWDEQPEIRPTESVAAGDLPHGPHCELGPTVTTFAYLNCYTTTSDYGPFVAPQRCQAAAADPRNCGHRAVQGNAGNRWVQEGGCELPLDGGHLI
jgi:hypothetical protein